MASSAAGHDVPKPPPRTDSDRAEPSHPEPACQEAQKWIEVSNQRSLWGVVEWPASGYKYAVVTGSLSPVRGGYAVSGYGVGRRRCGLREATLRASKVFAHMRLPLKSEARSRAVERVRG